jgi:hypothetical protein
MQKLDCSKCSNYSNEQKYSPEEIGRNAYRDGYGISDLWGMTKTDADTDIEAYIKEKEKEIKNVPNRK